LLFQNEFFVRIIAASTLQLWPIIYMSYFAYKLLKRAKNRSTYTLSSYFITHALGYFLATLSILLTNTPFAYIIYVASLYLLVLSYSFIIIFSWLLTRQLRRSNTEVSSTRYYAKIFIYAIGSLYVVVFAILFNGITLNASTEWTPHYSWFFLAINWTYFLLFLIIPQIYLSLKIRKMYEGIVLRKRLNLFILSVFLSMFLFISVLLYNTWSENLIYKTFHITIGIVFGITAAYLVYKGFGKDLE